jgi:hypothetical protein
MLAAFGCGLWVGVAAGLRVVQAVAQVEHGSLGVDLGQVVEVVVGWGEVVAHSRLLPPQGSSPATWPLRCDTNTFQTKGRTDRAVRAAPTVEMRLRGVHLSMPL